MNDNTFESDNGKTRGQDVLGLALAGLGAFFAVSILQALRGKQADSLLAQPVEGLMTVLGPWIGLFVAGATTAVGVMLFLSLEARPVGRQLVGVVAASIGIAIAVGGLVHGGGGAVGAILPSALGGPGGLIAGLVIGISICLASTWVTWLGSSSRTEPKPGAGTGLMARTNAIDGVSPAEALALQTTTEPESEHAGGVFADMGSEAFVPAPVRPLSPDESIQSTARQAQREASAGHTRPSAPPSRPVESASANLVAPLRDPDLADADTRASEFVQPTAAEASSLNGLARAGLPESTVPTPSWESPAAELDEPGLADDGWEQVGLFDEEEEPSLALSVTEPLAPVVEETESLELEEEPFEESSELEEDPEQVAELEEEEEEEYEEEEEDEETAELEEEEEEEEEYEEEEEDEEAAELEEEEEEEEYEEEEEDEEAAELEEEEEEEEEYEEEEEDEEAAELEEEEEEEEYEEEEEEEEESAELEEGEEEDEEDEEEEEEQEEAAELEEEAETEYLIQPVEKAAAGEQDAATPEPVVVGGEAGSLLFQAGNLIVEENRVAVSMIQRRFTLDFDQACELLDRLQQEGLIGPYVGGRNREILLSAEEWEEKAASLSA